MEGIAPPLRCLLEVRMSMMGGASTREALRGYLQGPQDEFSRVLYRWLMRVEAGHPTDEIKRRFKSAYRRTLVETFEHGLRGEPILVRLEELEKEMHSACYAELEQHLQRLPFITMVPLLLFQFPAFLVLLLGPIFYELTQGLSG